MSVESVIVQVRTEISSDPKARLNRGDTRDYDEREAKAAFDRMCSKYGW
jgi:hypothetical protein